MDFSKARTVLIGVFLFLNIFLLYQIWQDEGWDDFAFPGHKEEVSRLETALQAAGFSLEVPLPRGGVRLAHLEVEPWQFDAVELLLTWRALWEKGEEPFPAVEEVDNSWDRNLGTGMGTGTGRGKTFYCGKYSLHVEKEGLLVFTAEQQPAFDLKVVNKEAMLKAAQEIVQKTTYFKGFLFDYSRETEQGIVLYYRQWYEDYPLYSGYLEFFSGEGGEVVVSLYRLEPCEFATQAREIISPAAALLRFLEIYGPDVPEGGEETKNNKNIKEITPGFYSPGYDAERWEIPPVWRIRLGNGEVYYVNAFTGNLER